MFDLYNCHMIYYIYLSCIHYIFSIIMLLYLICYTLCYIYAVIILCKIFLKKQRIHTFAIRHSNHAVHAL